MNKLVLSTNIILGTLLLFSYFYIGSQQKKGTVEKLWGNIKGTSRTLTIMSIFIAGILYLPIIYYLGFKTDGANKELLKQILKYQAIFIIVSMIWMPLSISYLENKNILTKFGIIMTLFVVAMSVLMFSYKIFKLDTPLNNLKIMALVGCAYLFFHTFFMDFIVWNYNFL